MIQLIEPSNTCKSNQYPEYRTPIYFLVQAVCRVSNSEIFELQGVFEESNPETLPAQEISEESSPKILQAQPVSSVQTSLTFK